MRTRYAVITKFFDDGKVKVIGPLAFDGGEYKNETIEKENWDEYIDVFDNYNDASDFALEALEC